MKPAEIKERREAIPLTQGELAKRCGVNIQSIRHWEAGRRTPRPEQARALQAAFATAGDCDCQCHVLGLKRAGIPRWGHDEVEDLKRLVAAGQDPDGVVAALAERHVYRRTRQAVVAKARLIGLSFYGSRISANEAAHALGLDHGCVTRWISKGLLPAERHIGIDRGRASHWWQIHPDDLGAFVDRYAGIEFDPARVRDQALRARAEVAAAVNRRAV